MVAEIIISEKESTEGRYAPGAIQRRKEHLTSLTNVV